MDSIAPIQTVQSSHLVEMTGGSSAALETTTGESLCFATSLFLSASSVLLTNVSDWGTNKKQLGISEQGGEKRGNQLWNIAFFFFFQFCAISGKFGFVLLRDVGNY